MTNFNNREDIKKFVERLDLENIRRQFRSAYHKDRIAFMNRLSEREMDWVIDHLMTQADKNMNEKIAESFSKLRFPIGTPDHSDRPINYEEEEDYEL